MQTYIDQLVSGLALDKLVIGETTVDLGGEYDQYAWQENALSDLWADIYLDYGKIFGAEISLVNAGATWGNLKKGEIRGPGRNNWNMSLFKSFLISEKRNSRFEFRFETFNTFNHTQFSSVGTSFSNLGQFGVPTGVYDPRTLQLGARLIF